MHCDTGHLRYRDLAPRGGRVGNTPIPHFDAHHVAIISQTIGDPGQFENAFYSTRQERATGWFEGLSFSTRSVSDPGVLRQAVRALSTVFRRLAA
jgi:hypothetical protein